MRAAVIFLAQNNKKYFFMSNLLYDLKFNVKISSMIAYDKMKNR